MPIFARVFPRGSNRRGKKLAASTGLPLARTGIGSRRAIRPTAIRATDCRLFLYHLWKTAIPPPHACGGSAPRSFRSAVLRRFQRRNSESRAQAGAFTRSVLDFALDDANRLKNNLDSATDRHKLDEYLTAIRETEQRIEGAEQFYRRAYRLSKPTGIPHDFQQHARLMFRLRNRRLYSRLIPTRVRQRSTDCSRRPAKRRQLSAIRVKRQERASHDTSSPPPTRRADKSRKSTACTSPKVSPISCRRL